MAVGDFTTRIYNHVGTQSFDFIPAVGTQWLLLATGWTRYGSPSSYPATTQLRSIWWRVVSGSNYLHVNLGDRIILTPTLTLRAVKGYSSEFGPPGAQVHAASAFSAVQVS